MPKRVSKSKDADIEAFYKTFDLTNVKYSKNVDNELLRQLYKNQPEKKKTIPKHNNMFKRSLLLTK